MCRDVRLHHANVVVASGQLPLLPHVVDADQQRPRLPASLLERQKKNTNNNNGCRYTKYAVQPDTNAVQPDQRRL